MADPLYELLAPYFEAQDDGHVPSIANEDPITSTYLNRLTTLSVADLQNTEAQILAAKSQSTLRSLQVLAKRSHKPIVSSSGKLEELAAQLPTIITDAGSLEASLQPLEEAASAFGQKYSKTASESAVLDRRRDALLLSRNVDRLAEVLDLPMLLASAITSSSSSAAAGTSAASVSTATAGQSGAPPSSTASSSNYASALDLHAHIKRLHTTYPNSPLVDGIAAQAEQEIKGMAAGLISSLQNSQNLKLAAAMRTVGWLRRVAPELDDAGGGIGGYNRGSTRGAVQRPLGLGLGGNSSGGGEGSLGALFLVCRLMNLEAMLEALDPLRELADQETEKRKGTKGSGPVNTAGKRGVAAAGGGGGQQTERYIKRWLEVFREQSFAVMSTYRSIFPSAIPPPFSAGEDEVGAAAGRAGEGPTAAQMLHHLPSPLATFPMHLVDMLMDMLRRYLPNVSDATGRESLLTQVLYCAGSLGRLGADFGTALALLLEELAEERGTEDGAGRAGHDEWIDVVKKHRIQASRLELLASGVGAGAKSGSLALKNTGVAVR